jgi:ATP-dependent Clp protease ATP-binding subunit ClpX
MNQLEEPRCSFCGKKEPEVSKLVGGPGVNICDRCVNVASQIVNNIREDNEPSKDQPLTRH